MPPMADSEDDEYIASLSDDADEDLIISDADGNHRPRRAAPASGRPRPQRSTTAAAAEQKRKKKKNNRANAGGSGFELSRTWETLVEGADGTINSAVENIVEATKRKRLLRDTTPLQRGIIRHVVLVLDLSSAMTEKDLRPTRYLLSIRYAQEFVVEFFEQNPISQLAVMGMRDGLAVRVSDMSGNPTEHLLALNDLRTHDPAGMPSLQNSLEMARGALFHTPTHGTREVLIIFGALLSSDPGDIHHTISALVADRIRVSIVGLAAEVAVCRELCTRTNSGDDSVYGIALDEVHFRELVMATTTPPVAHSREQASNSLLRMGFPSRVVEDAHSLCACHARPSRYGYLCSRCGSKVCNLPAECPACGLTLILSTHLARSYHHLFPLKNFEEVSWQRAAEALAEADGGISTPTATATATATEKEAGEASSGRCFSCDMAFPAIPPAAEWEALTAATKSKGISASSRYECSRCRRHFCIDCDLFLHEIVHNCPGCQSAG